MSVAQNEHMKRITAWAAMIAVPTMIAGIYGMNFAHMPELQWEYGYYLVPGRDGAGLRRPCIFGIPALRMAVSVKRDADPAVRLPTHPRIGSRPTAR